MSAKQLSADAAKLVPLTAGIINYNGGNVVIDTIRSLLDSGYPAGLDIVVADNCSTDGSPVEIEKTFPGVRLIRMAENFGPNGGRNAVLKAAKTDLVFVTDNDITVDADTLPLLVSAMTENPSAGAATPTVMDSIDRNQIYSAGVKLHYVCFAIIDGRYTRFNPMADLGVKKRTCGSGGIMMVRKPSAGAVGYFDEEFQFGYDDGEFTYRLSAAGFDVLQVPRAKIYHEEKPGRGTGRLRYQLRGRWELILKNYATRSLILLAPALIFFELCMFSFMLLKGTAGEWFRGLKLALSGFGRTMHKRRETLKRKRRADRDLLDTGEIFMFPSRKGGGVMEYAKKTMELILDSYWNIVKRFLTA